MQSGLFICLALNKTLQYQLLGFVTKAEYQWTSQLLIYALRNTSQICQINKMIQQISEWVVIGLFHYIIEDIA